MTSVGVTDLFTASECYLRSKLICSSLFSGLYPALPDVSHTDFSLLTDEEEWGLVFNYIWVYPEMIRSTVSALEEGKLRVSLHTHKVRSGVNLNNFSI